MPLNNNSFVHYFWKTNRSSIIIGLVFLVFAILTVESTNSDHIAITSLEGWFGQHLNPIIGIVTVLIALAIWYFETHQNWKKNLPIRVSVCYRYLEQPIMYIHKLKIASVTDLRALSKGVIQDINKVKNAKLSFSPYFDIKLEEKELDSKEGYIQHYNMTYDLLEENTNLHEHLKNGTVLRIFFQNEKGTAKEHESSRHEFMAKYKLASFEDPKNIPFEDRIKIEINNNLKKFHNLPTS